MSKKKATDADEDQFADDADAPMKDPYIEVDVKPVKHKTRNVPREQKRKAQKQNQANRDLADKIERNLEEKIKKDIKEAGSKPGGTRQNQYDATDKAAEDASHSVQRQQINEIDVTVEDHREAHHTQVTPKEGAPPSDEDD